MIKILKISLKIFGVLSTLGLLINLIIFISAWLINGYIGFFLFATIPMNLLLIALWALFYIANPINGDIDASKRFDVSLKKKLASLWLCVILIICTYGFVDDGNLEDVTFGLASFTVVYAVSALVLGTIVKRFRNLSATVDSGKSISGSFSKIFNLTLTVVTIGILVSLLILGSVTYQVGG